MIQLPICTRCDSRRTVRVDERDDRTVYLCKSCGARFEQLVLFPQSCGPRPLAGQAFQGLLEFGKE